MTRVSDCELGLGAARELSNGNELKPLRTDWAGTVAADWLAIAHVTAPKSFESFQLALLGRPAGIAGECCGTKSTLRLITWMDFDTFQIAIDQARAMFGVECVEWEACRIEITGPGRKGLLEQGCPERRTRRMHRTRR